MSFLDPVDFHMLGFYLLSFKYLFFYVGKILWDTQTDVGFTDESYLCLVIFNSALWE